MYFTPGKNLFVARRTGLEPENPYYGMNISRGKEPLDQMDFLFFARRNGLPVTIFVAGKYGLLNRKGEPAEFLIGKERTKAELYRKLFALFGISGKVLATDDLWSSSKYWDGVADLAATKGIITSGSGESLRALGAERLGIPVTARSSFERVLERVGDLPAQSL